MNRQGASYGFWIEVILFIVLFVSALAIIGSNMNGLYDENYDYSFGLVTNDTKAEIESYQETLVNSTSEGQASQTAFLPLVLTTVPHMLMTVNSIIINFISGGFINTLVDLMNLGDYGNIIIVIFKLMYFIAIMFILIKIITKVVV